MNLSIRTTIYVKNFDDNATYKFSRSEKKLNIQKPLRYGGPAAELVMQNSTLRF